MVTIMPAVRTLLYVIASTTSNIDYSHYTTKKRFFDGFCG